MLCSAGLLHQCMRAKILRSRAGPKRCVAAPTAPGSCAPCPSPPAEADAAILLELRASVHAWNPAWSGGWDGWQLASGAAPCAWHGVTCDRQGRVLKL